MPNLPNIYSIAHHQAAFHVAKKHSYHLQCTQNRLQTINREHQHNNDSTCLHFNWLRQYQLLKRQASSIDNQIRMIIDKQIDQHHTTPDKMSDHDGNSYKKDEGMDSKINMGLEIEPLTNCVHDSNEISGTNHCDENDLGSINEITNLQEKLVHNDEEEIIAQIHRSSKLSSSMRILQLLRFIPQQRNISDSTIQHEAIQIQTLLAELKYMMLKIKQEQIGTKFDEHDRNRQNDIGDSSNKNTLDSAPSQMTMFPHITKSEIPYSGNNDHSYSLLFTRDKQTPKSNESYDIKENYEQILANVILEFHEYFSKVQYQLEREYATEQKLVFSLRKQVCGMYQQKSLPLEDLNDTLDHFLTREPNTNNIQPNGEEPTYLRKGWTLLPKDLKNAFQNLFHENTFQKKSRELHDGDQGENREVPKDTHFYFHEDIENLLKDTVQKYMDIQKDYERTILKTNSAVIKKTTLSHKLPIRMYGGWTEQNHSLFVEILRQFDLLFSSHSISSNRRQIICKQIKSKLPKHITHREIMCHLKWYEQTFFQKQKRKVAHNVLQRKQNELLPIALNQIKTLQKQIWQRIEIDVSQTITKALQSEKQARLLRLRQAREEANIIIRKEKAKEAVVKEKKEQQIDIFRKKEQEMRKKAVRKYKEIIEQQRKEEQSEDCKRKANKYFKKISRIKENKHR